MPEGATATTQAQEAPTTAQPQTNGTLEQAPAPNAGSHPAAGDRRTGSRAPNDSDGTGAGQRINDSIVPRPRVLRPETLAFQRLETREGVVLSVDWDADVFRARLVDPRGHEPDQEVEVELAQVSPRDLDLVAEGAWFFWAIGYMTRASGRRSLVLAIDFRRLPRPDPGVEDRARKDALTYIEDMRWT